MESRTEPSEAAISSFIDLTNLPRSNAIKWLSINKNEAETAVNAWIDSGLAPVPPAQPRERYDENLFQYDRANNPPQYPQEAASSQDGGTMSQGGPQSLFASTTQSAGRSETQQANSASGQSFQESEEEQIRRATAMSLGQAPAQGSGTSFGPSLRDDHDKDSWAMTNRAENQVAEIYLTPEPVERARGANGIAILKPLPAAGSLPAILTLLHAIPLAREALLLRQSVLESYDYINTWSNGSFIQQSTTVRENESERNQILREIIYDVQRFMAFLDSSERAYTSVDSLVNLCSKVYCQAGQTAQFLSTWREAARLLDSQASLADIFISHGVQRKGPDFQRQEVIDSLSVSIGADLANTGATLYDALDAAIWDEMNENDTYFASLAEVFILVVENTSHKYAHDLGIEVPPTLHLGRYTEDNVAAARTLRSQKSDLLAQQERNLALQRKLRALESKNGKVIGAETIVKSIKTFIQQSMAYRSAQNIAGNDSEPDESSKLLPTVLKDLNLVEDLITNKLNELELENASVPQRLRELAQPQPMTSTGTSTGVSTSSENVYTLRGVRTLPHILYILSKQDGNDRSDKLDSSGTNPTWTWLKIEYCVQTPHPLKTSRLDEAEVLLAARHESPQCVLIYASDKAVHAPCDPAPLSLQELVKSDNEAFRNELGILDQPISTNIRPEPDNLHGSSPPHKRKVSPEAETEGTKSSTPAPNDRTLPDV